MLLRSYIFYEIIHAHPSVSIFFKRYFKNSTGDTFAGFQLERKDHQTVHQDRSKRSCANSYSN